MLNRTDSWVCEFYEYVYPTRMNTSRNGNSTDTAATRSNYGCDDSHETQLIFPAGVNSLGGIGWQTKIHSVKCDIESDD